MKVYSVFEWTLPTFWNPAETRITIAKQRILPPPRGKIKKIYNHGCHLCDAMSPTRTVILPECTHIPYLFPRDSCRKRLSVSTLQTRETDERRPSLHSLPQNDDRRDWSTAVELAQTRSGRNSELFKIADVQNRLPINHEQNRDNKDIFVFRESNARHSDKRSV